MRFLILLVLSSVLAAQPAPPATYDKSFSDRYCVVTSEEPKFPENTPLEPEVVVNSPIGSSIARVVRTDGTKIPYDDAEAHITVVSAFGDTIYFRSKGFRTVNVQWIGERFLFISKGAGHESAIPLLQTILSLLC